MTGALVDSSVVLDISTGDAKFYDASLECLARWGARGELYINDFVYTEVSIGFERIEDLDSALAACNFVHLAIPTPALFLEGKAFLRYRRRCGVKTQPLPDFFLGAHAAVASLPLITRDPKRVRDTYPSLRIIEPK